MNGRLRPHRVLCALAALFVTLPGAAGAQSAFDRPPNEGGRTFQLGMPPVWKGYAGGTFGWYRPNERTDQAFVQAHMGIFKDLLTPVAGVAALGVEGYGGVRGEDGFDGGARALFSIPAFRFSTGADYNISDDDWSWLLRLEIPFRRGGIFGRGSLVRFDYMPGFDHTFAVGLNVPLWGRNNGQTRPQDDAVELETPPVRHVSWESRPPGLDEAIANLREGARWIAELSMPLTDEGGGEPEKKYGAQIARIREHVASVDGRFPNGRSLPEEIRVFHEEMDRAFALASGVTGLTPEQTSDLGRYIATAARNVLLDEILLPYDRLLGQRKENDGLAQFRAAAQAEFGRWILQESGIEQADYESVYWVFQTLGEIAEDVRAFQKERWEDSRFVWLPLQLALRAEDHDEAAELHALIEKGTDERFTAGNRTMYVMNEEFQLEFFRSVHAAEDYHVLWIHDYRGTNGDGDPDEVAFRQTVDGYLAALTDRVRDYDRTGRITQYFIFLDQNYFEANNSRLFFRVLLDPMGYDLDLPNGYEAWEEKLAAAQEELRRAVAESKLLQTERAQYGDAWLEDRIRVHINITNPSDFSFNSLHVAGILPVPDNLMRDHRKIAFYDITEADPYRGRAMFTGMGIGEHYAGANWEDRAVVIVGPAALPVKDAARALLEQQGFGPEEMPLPLRKLEKPDDYWTRVDSARAAGVGRIGADLGYVLQLHNRTGFAEKPIDVEKAILYSLMPEGSLLKVPDSLWQSYVYASLLMGSALRGCDVLLMLPSLRSAPSSAKPTMARAHDLFSGIIVMKNGLAAEIDARGGLLKTGLYHPNVGVGDLAGRIRQAREITDPWLRSIYPENPAMRSVVDSVESVLERAGFTGRYLITSDSTESPKLHMKANFFITGRAWRELMALPEWGPVIREYLKYLAVQVGPPEQRPEGVTPPEPLLAAVRDLTAALLARIPDEAERGREMAFFTIGSTNMDYRSMVMDGEVQVTLSGWNTLPGLIDFVMIAGLCDWVDTQEELDALLPPPGGFTRTLANFMKLAL